MVGVCSVHAPSSVVRAIGQGVTWCDAPTALVHISTIVNPKQTLCHCVPHARGQEPGTHCRGLAGVLLLRRRANQVQASLHFFTRLRGAHVLETTGAVHTARRAAPTGSAHTHTIPGGSRCGWAAGGVCGAVPSDPPGQVVPAPGLRSGGVHGACTRRDSTRATASPHPFVGSA
jgi:hypothetical protein